VASYVYGSGMSSLAQAYGTNIRTVLNLGGSMSSFGYNIATQAISSAGATGTRTMSYSGVTGSAIADAIVIGVK
jgi:hypothetical protein